MPEREKQSIETELDPPVEVLEPVHLTSPLVFSSPHSGRIYPRHFRAQSRLSETALRRSEDVLVDELFACAAAIGAPLLTARFPRAYLDVNREPFELDPHLFHGVLPAFANTRSMRVLGGLGTVARLVAENEAIYSGRLDVAVAMVRIEKLYKPYHQTLGQLLRRARARFGYAVLIDCHSMPSATAGGIGGRTQTRTGTQRADIVLGDRFGASCDPALTRLVRRILKDAGYGIALNRPYAGGYITEHYGRPAGNVHALQIELNRALYLDEATLQPLPAFSGLRTDLRFFVEQLNEWLPSLFVPRAAAE